jgi:hypothetical protein
MEIKAKEKTGLLVFGFIFAWVAFGLMLSNFFELLSAYSISWWIVWALCAVCALGSSLFLGVGFGAEFGAEEADSKAS